MKGNDPTDYLQKSSRRRILSLSAGALATGVAGCVGGLDDGSDQTPTETSTPIQTEETTLTTTPVRHEQVDPFTEVARTETQSTTTVSFEVPLEAGQFAHRELRIEEPSELQITGESTARMDVFLLVGEGAFSKYQAGESDIFSGRFTATEIESIDRTVEVSPGRYFLVFDNTPVYGVDPQDEVNSQFEIVISSDSSAPTETPTPTPTPTETPTPTPTPTPEPPDQPKIREVQDNRGHTFSQFSGDTGGSVHVDDEIVVDDDTSVELCVTEIAKQNNDDINFDYWFGNMRSEHPDSPEGWNNSNCWNWDMGRDYYSSSWTFQIWIQNQDEIHYHNNSNESDFRVVIYYTNLTLADE